VQVAKTMSSLAVLCGERLKFGIGTSPFEEDFTVFGIPFEHRGSRLEEGVAIFRGLMTGDYFGYSGKFYQFKEIKINPVPKQPIPILTGGHAPVMLRRTARIADGWISAPIPHAELKPLVEQLQQCRRDAGTQTRPFEIHGFDTDIVDVASARRARDIGVTDAQVIPWMRLGPEPTLQEKIDSIQRFGDDVIAKFS
jgi:alkanesulfonate monooxygenase SsuD/methylene tetrahydromethanopterin reductase-like flavin-dependent oxidoreductase (luciferase family)